MTSVSLHLLALGTAFVLAALALVHVYWAIAGGSGSGFVPEVNSGPVFRPSRAATWAVAAALGGASLVVAQRGSADATLLPSALTHWGTWVIAVLFVARAIGDFRLVGFFKRVRSTRFATLDTWLFSPLCAVIGLASGVVAAGGG